MSETPDDDVPFRRPEVGWLRETALRNQPIMREVEALEREIARKQRRVEKLRSKVVVAGQATLTEVLRGYKKTIKGREWDIVYNTEGTPIGLRLKKPAPEPHEHEAPAAAPKEKKP